MAGEIAQIGLARIPLSGPGQKGPGDRTKRDRAGPGIDFHLMAIQVEYRDCLDA